MQGSSGSLRNIVSFLRLPVPTVNSFLGETPACAIAPSVLRRIYGHNPKRAGEPGRRHFT